MDSQIAQRLRWVELCEKTNDAGLGCRRCGISRPTLRLWVRRYKQQGLDGPADRSRRPTNSPAAKAFERQEQLILSLRQRRLGARRMQSELLREHDCKLSLATIHEVLKRHDSPPLKRSRLTRKKRHRYERPVPGDRVQMDTCKIAPKLYQYTAIDDCTRVKVLAIYSRRTAANYSRRTAANSLLFLQLDDWQIYYNEFRSHGSLRGQTPWERWGELSLKTPLRDEVESLYDPSKEWIQHQNYRVELELRKLKASV